jgi:hypothetical protein
MRKRARVLTESKDRYGRARLIRLSRYVYSVDWTDWHWPIRDTSSVVVVKAPAVRSKLAAVLRERRRETR